MRAEAQREPDPVAREALESDSGPLQERWRCPSIGYPIPEDSDDLDAGCREACANVDRLTRCGPLHTCPIWYAGLPQVHRAVALYDLRESPLALEMEPGPSPALLEAVRLVGRGVNDRQANDLERDRAKREQERRERERNG